MITNDAQPAKHNPHQAEKTEKTDDNGAENKDENSNAQQTIDAVCGDSNTVNKYTSGDRVVENGGSLI